MSRPKGHPSEAARVEVKDTPVLNEPQSTQHIFGTQRSK
jgi:hypothetical protein